MICSLNLLSNFWALQGLGCVESDLSSIIMASMGMTVWGLWNLVSYCAFEKFFFLIMFFLYCIHFAFCLIVITNELFFVDVWISLKGWARWIQFNITFTSLPRSYKLYLSFRFYMLNFICISHLSHAYYMPYQYHHTWYDYSNISKFCVIVVHRNKSLNYSSCWCNSFLWTIYQLNLF
jgi:hypothetical protein